MYLQTSMFENSVFHLSLCLQDICKLTDAASPFYNFLLPSAMTVLQNVSWLVQYYPDVALTVTAWFPARSLLLSALKIPCE